MKQRCVWAREVPDIYIKYHDEEWGVPSHDDRHLFEMLILEGFQAGLSWLTILKKREAFREAFDHFDPVVIQHYGEEKIEALMANEGIIRNRLKIRATIGNAIAFLQIQKEWGSFDAYLWHFTDGAVVYDNIPPMPVSSPLSDEISKDLKKRGMKFVGSTIMYAYLQAMGIIQAHEPDCFLHQKKQG